MILDGLTLKNKILEEAKEKIERNNLKLKLAIIQIGDNLASNIYIKNKKIACEKVGISVVYEKLETDTTEEELIKLIEKFNKDDSITGIILQSPLPNNLDFDKCSSCIHSNKDVDGFTKDNIYKLYLNQKSIMPCTVKGILRLLQEYKISIEGANTTIIGRGNIVGKPLALAMENRNATVTLCHSRTKNLKEITRRADIVIAACGVPHLITADMIKEKSIVIDVGITKKDGKIIGDVDFENVKNKASYITPNPGGVGPMTVAMIIDNLIEMGGR